MEYNKILSEYFCQAAILALRDWAIEFETASHDGYFMYSVYNEVRWWKIAENISKLSAFYIPFYALTRGLDPQKLKEEDARRIFLYMLIAELEDGNRVSSMVSDCDTGIGYEGVLYALYTMCEEKAMQGFDKLSPEIKKIWSVNDAEYDPIDYVGMLSLEKLEAEKEEQGVEVRVKMLNYLFANLLRECLLMKPDIAQAAFCIPWDKVIGYQTEDELKRFVGSHPDDYNDPVITCETFFAALNAASKAAPLVQLLNKIDMDKLKQQMLDLLPSYITYYERQSYDLFYFYCALNAPTPKDYKPIEFNEDDLPL